MTPSTSRLLAVVTATALAASACGGSSDDSSGDTAVADTEAAATNTEATTDTEAEPADTEAAADTEAEPAADTEAEPAGTEATTDTETAATTSGANTAEVVAAADALMSTLSDEQIDSLLFEFGDASLASTWSNLPACGDSARPGIAYGDLTEDQLAATLAVSQAALSDEGYVEYTQIVAADDVLGSDSSGPGANVWNSDCYYLAFYGEPSDTTEWAMMFGGHHYARILTYTGDVATITPAFTGVEPTSFEVDGVTVQPMADEVDGMFGIFGSFDDDQLATAEIDGVFNNVLLGPGEDEFPETVGVPGSELSDDQKALVLSAVRSWIDDFDASIADGVMATVESELDETYFSWASSIDTNTEGAYARIDGPTVWIEVANQAGVGTDDVHNHSIYRNKVSDYGNAG